MGVGAVVVVVDGRVVVVVGSTLVTSWSHLCELAETHNPTLTEKMVVGGQKNWIGVSVPRLFRMHSMYDWQLDPFGSR